MTRPERTAVQTDERTDKTHINAAYRTNRKERMREGIEIHCICGWSVNVITACVGARVEELPMRHCYTLRPYNNSHSSDELKSSLNSPVRQRWEE